ncbi:MAG: OmpH family outer membrane protein [Candidatus Krumholzibacteriota bacterium]|nr:OmpH family outer membrane protein [Candidatus Krumholzibacteriota bacterium]
MKRYAIAFVAILLTVLACGTAAAQEQKIGYIDTGKIFAEFKETVEAEEVYAKEVADWKQKAEAMEAELAQMRESLQSQSLMLSEEKLAEKKLELDQKFKEYQQYMQDVFGDNGEAARRNRELTQPIVEKINGVIATIAKEQGYTIILDAAQGNIVYAIKEIDLTEAVLLRLQEQMESIQ